jgi:DNA-binding MarR family transcriptional regulator
MIPAKPASKAQRLPGSAVPAVPGLAVGLSSADPAQRVLRQFRQVFNSVKTHFQQVEKHAGLGGAQVWALAIIRDQAGVGVNDLAKAMDVRQPTASNLVRALAEQGHIEVRKEAQDRRAVQLYLRPSGTQVLHRAPGPFSGVLPKALAGLDPATLQRLEQDLDVLIRALGPDERAAAIPLGEM